MRYCDVNPAGRSVVLIGMMGAGKSSVGRCLQRRTRLTLLDTDDIVTSRFGIPIAEIFAKHGEDRFREAETQAVRDLASSKQAIIVTGGGIVLRKKNMDVLKRLGVVVWLDGNEEILFERAWKSENRPLLGGANPKKAFAQIRQARRPLYCKAAHLRVDTSVLTEEEVAVAILSKLAKLDSNRRPGSSRSCGITAR